MVGLRPVLIDAQVLSQFALNGMRVLSVGLKVHFGFELQCEE
jgi:hypothetical protein